MLLIICYSSDYFIISFINIKYMATVYKVEIVSDWISYKKGELQKILEDAVKEKERNKGNTIRIRVIERI